jgi:hypothetical protein
MLAVLIKPFRDNCGRWRNAGEHVVLVSMNVRAEFDTRLLINVVFENCAHGALFSDEIQLILPFSSPNPMGLTETE